MESESPKTEKTEVFPFEPTSDLFFYPKSIIEEENFTIFDENNDLRYIENPKTRDDHNFYFQAALPEKYSSHSQISNITLLQMQNIKMDVDPVLSTASSIMSGLESEKQEEEEEEEEKQEEEEREEERTEEEKGKKEKMKEWKKEKGKRRFRADKMESCCTCKRNKCKKAFCECLIAGSSCGKGCPCTECNNKGFKRINGDIRPLKKIKNN